MSQHQHLNVVANSFALFNCTQESKVDEWIRHYVMLIYSTTNSLVRAATRPFSATDIYELPGAASMP